MKKLLMTLALMPLMALAASLKIGDETFKPSDKTGYTYAFSSCSATATYNASSGFRLTFGTSAVIVGNISWADGPGLSINIDPGATVALSGSITSNYGGELEICGPGRLQIINGCIAAHYANVKFFGAIVDISTSDKSRPILTYGTVDIKLSCVSISGYGALVHGHEGVNITASMVNLLSWPTSQGRQYAVLQHGNSQVGKPGGVSIVGSVVSIVGRDTETAGILTRRGLLITESCLAIVSDGPCISVSHTQDGGAQYFDNVRLFAVSQHGNAFDDDLAGNANYAFWGDGKYVLCAASEEKAAMVAKTVEVDDGDIELCSPQNYGAVAHTFLMKDGSFKMSGKLNKKLLREEILVESAVEGVLTASLGWTSVQSEILLNMLEKLDAVLTTDVSGRAVAAVMSQEFVQTGGRVEQGAADCGHLAVDKYMARTKNGKTPAFTGGVFDGSFLMDYDVTDPHPLVNAPTNALGQTLTRVEYEPYWVYLNGGVTPTVCKVVFNANGGSCSTTSRKVTKGAAVGTLPTATWSGYAFDGWYTSASGGSKVSESTVVTSDVTWYAHWQAMASAYTIQFDAGADGYWTTTANQRRTCKLNTVYALDMPNGLTGLSGKRLAGWRCSNGKRYDPGVLFFNLAQVGKSVTMTAIWESSTARIAREGGLYAVVDISGGTDAATYPISYLSAVPKGGWTDEYKTTKMVFRRIEPGSFTMKDVLDGSPATLVTLTKPFYMGVFEVTQRQYELITGNRPFKQFFGDKRAANGLSYEIVRGKVNGARWPTSMAVDEGTVIDFLRKKTGLDTIDLPTEAEWEYACRAGTTTAYNNGTSKNPEAVGRIACNSDDGAGGYQYLTMVGCYPANNWGLFDMHGNIAELCLDWYGKLSNIPVSDPKGCQSGTHRVLRGGSWASERYGWDYIEDGVRSWNRVYVCPEDVLYYNRYVPQGGVGVGGDSGRRLDYLNGMSNYLPEIGIRLAIRELDVGE